MTDREIVEWVANAYVGKALPPELLIGGAVDWMRIAEALHREIGFRMPGRGERWIDWCMDAQRAAASAR